MQNYHHQESTQDHLFEIRKLSAISEAEDPENEPKEWIVTVWKLTE